ncbi:tRNA/rRNA methyltransferase [Sphingomonas sp. PP-F2F-A104-K0414]|uniref:TrmH family RNA methyltransferase n=1 Tax=Sphingomonas sp. PP-F2F-A104-K0414 TaxID=2135661 RepID=UPI0010452B5E|nr:TrmH family RNA methyltransferase [Sphingomonas sp. PP-F2F-A104-K0414]TCQ01110.1 tRNA/rRNA methyltransferase [Sphingomonas sp. PP-F2F-A104-K0414]
MTFWAYVVRCADDSYYTGHTDNLERRIGQHNLGEISGYTQTRRPVTLLWCQDFGSRQEALAAEFQVKGWSRRKKEALAREDWADLHDAAIPPRERALRLRSGRTEEEDGQSEDRAGISSEQEKSVTSGGENHVRSEEGKSALSSPPVRAERSRSTLVDETPPPVIVLVRPQLGENIGKAARAMLNFGLTEMRLVSPRDGWPNPSAGPAASGADIVLQTAKVYDSVAAATADCAQIYATTVRKRGVTKPVVTPEQAATEIHAAPGRSAILFGPERSGLETDDVAVARTIITVPINPEFGSLNLAQAVILVAYEWSKGLTAERGLSQPSINPIMPPAPQEELDGMIGQLDAMLMGAGFFHLPDKMQSTRRTLRTLLTKPGWSSQEIRTLRGVLSSLAGKRPRA